MEEKLIIDAITQLNEVFIVDEFHIPDFFGFTYSSDGYSDAVCFMDIRIWCSDDDTRYFNDDSLEYEPYFDCFKRLALEIIDNLVAVRPALENVQTGDIL